MIKKYEETAKGKPPQTFRLTGRDGPPGSTMIPGAPAWLAKGTPVYGSYVFVVACIAFGYLIF